jgi:glycosyltransferase involved in cell wall biosynthesis
VAVAVVSNLDYGGAQRQVIELANEMDPQRFEVHVCSLDRHLPLANTLRLGRDRHHVIQKRWKFDAWVVFRLARLLRSLQADVVHGFLHDAEIASRLAGRLAKRPVVIGSERNTNYHIKRRQLLAYRLTRKCHDLTIANSNAGADYNSRMLHQPRNCYRVVHNGVNVDRFQPRSGTALRAELGVPPDELLVGMFASFKPQKNHPLLLRAARRVLTQFPRMRLLFVGDDLYLGLSQAADFKRAVCALVEELDLSQRCLFAGNRVDVERYYNACDFTVLSSLYEGTPNVVLESMASGVPVIASDVSDNALVIPNGQAGLVVPSEDEHSLAEGMLRMLKDAALRERMGRFAREWALQEFSGRRLAEKTADVYEEAMALRHATCSERH